MHRIVEGGRNGQEGKEGKEGKEGGHGTISPEVAERACQKDREAGQDGRQDA
ncbi:hypothetical protein [Rhodopseudomonas sp. AAP120]|uniref:hypothetical protein n=1 Tax=Rhodopseudomonas sp. AAP120 TaxID=1523430 RepID=UPI0012E15437|nr:hypothetical protein [Rhodopseudomonas sp. AAP120]